MATALSNADVTTEAESVVPPALRSDLTIRHQLFEGSAFAIIKDPLSLKYFRLPAEDFALAALFDGQRSVAAIRQAFMLQQPQAALRQTAAEITARIQSFAQELLRGGFLEATVAATRQQIRVQKLPRQGTSPWAWFMKSLFLKLPLWDPDALLIRLERRLRWIWSWAGLVISLLILLGGFVVFLLNFPRISPALNDFLTLPNLTLIWGLTLVVKIIHEFGHGLTCKHYGGEVHEMGAMVIVFSPFLYADVTDSYLFPKRRQRILVAAAGIYIELVIAAGATLLWAVSQPGPTQQLLFNLMLITSVWTVLFNANPLMKFDGYYILIDLLDVPNLRAKAQMCVSDLLRRLLFGPAGGAVADTSQLPRRHRGWFVFYSVAAQLYLLYVTLGIAMLFHHLLKPYGLAWLGDGLGVGALISMLLIPAMSFFTHHFKAQRHAPPPTQRRPRMILGGAVLGALALLWLPWPVRIERPALLQPLHAAFVRAEVAGRLTTMQVQTGQDVKQGEVLAHLEQPRLNADVRAAELRWQRAQRELDLTLGASAPAAFRQAQTRLEQARVSLQEAQSLAAKLVLRAPQSGTIITPDLARLNSASLRPGDALCEIAALDPIELFLPLNERQARYISAGQRITLRVAALAGMSFEGQVLENLRTPPVRELPPNLVATLGGDLAAAPDAQGRLTPLETTFGVRISLPNPQRLLRPGMTGTVRLEGPVLPLHQILWLKLLDFISLDYRL